MVDLDSFTDKLQRGLSRRKRELSQLRMMIQQISSDVDQLSWVARASIMLAYAHWEGFVKNSSSQYVKLINSKRIRLDRLKLPLQAACLASHFKRAQGSDKVSHLGSLLSEIDATRCNVFSVEPAKLVNTESNLSSVVFKEIVVGLGLEYLPLYQTRQAFIDEKLVHSRNQVAHGELVSFSQRDADERIEGVLPLLSQFADQLIDAVRDESFMAS